MPGPKNPKRMIDSDRDGLSDAVERRIGTNPKNKDTDGDRVSDGQEYANGENPIVRGPRDVPRHLVADMDRIRVAWERDNRGGRSNADDDRNGVADWAETIPGVNPPGRAIVQPRDDFVRQAMSQKGVPYKYGAQADPLKGDARAFDSGELVEWAAHRAGVRDMPDGVANQFRWLHRDHVTVERALDTPGALVFGAPKGSHGRPSLVAISVGDGTHVIEVSERTGKVEKVPVDRDVYFKGATIPQLHEPKGDTDGDGYSDEEELFMGGHITLGDGRVGLLPPSGAGAPTPSPTTSPTVSPDAASTVAPSDGAAAPAADGWLPGEPPGEFLRTPDPAVTPIDPGSSSTPSDGPGSPPFSGIGARAAAGAAAGTGTGAPSVTVPPDAGAMVSPLVGPANPLDPTDPVGADRYQPDAGSQVAYPDDPTGAAGYADPDDGGATAIDTYGGDGSSAFGAAGTGDPGAAYGAASYGGGPTGGGAAYADSGPTDAGQAYGEPGQPGQTYAQAGTGSGAGDEYGAFDDEAGEVGGEVDAGFYDDTSIA